MNIMYEDNFKQALFDALTPEYVQILNNASDDHVFSQKFERKMQKLIKRRNKPYYKIVNTIGKRVACIAVIIIVASSITVMSVKALREAVADLFVSIYEKFSSVQSAESSNTPATIEDIYNITVGLDNYEVVFEDTSNRWHSVTYVNGEQIIDFSQYTIDGYNMNINTENATIHTININENEAIYYFDNNNYWNIIWNNGTYIIKISSNISKDALIDIAESVQKVE